jgi:hypothetical protein
MLIAATLFVTLQDRAEAKARPQAADTALSANRQAQHDAVDKVIAAQVGDAGLSQGP